MSKSKSVLDFLLRITAAAAIVSLLGFYPAYLKILHVMSNIVQGQVVRFF